MVLFLKNHKKTEMQRAEILQQVVALKEKNQFYLSTAQVMLYFLKEFSFDLQEIDADSFKRQTSKFYDDISSEKPVKKLKPALDDYKECLVVFLEQEKKYLRDREEEFKNIISVLTEGITKVGKEDEEFNARIYQQTLRLEKISYLEDIRRVREELKQEISRMKEVIQEKQLNETLHFENLSRKVDVLQANLEQAQHKALIDGLTGAFNRLGFDSCLKKMVERNAVTGEIFSLLMIDLDNLKGVNDTYGHLVGDRVLVTVVQKCRTFIRKDDFIARYGGDEFAIILPGVSLRGAMKKARSICKAIAGGSYVVEGFKENEKITVSVSIGVGAFKRGDTAGLISERADKAMYLSKQRGKNQIASQKDLTL